MPLFPLYQEQLGYNQGSNEDEDHFGVHGFVSTVLGMHACMLDPESQTDVVSQVRSGKGAVLSRDTLPVQSSEHTLVLCSCRVLFKSEARNTHVLEDRHLGIEQALYGLQSPSSATGVKGGWSTACPHWQIQLTPFLKQERDSKRSLFHCPFQSYFTGRRK